MEELTQSKPRRPWSFMDTVGRHIPCPECGVNPGELHEPGCSQERCPGCIKPLATCSCMVLDMDEACCVVRGIMDNMTDQEFRSIVLDDSQSLSGSYRAEAVGLRMIIEQCMNWFVADLVSSDATGSLSVQGLLQDKVFVEAWLPHAVTPEAIAKHMDIPIHEAQDLLRYHEGGAGGPVNVQ